MCNTHFHINHFPSLTKTRYIIPYLKDFVNLFKKLFINLFKKLFKTINQVIIVDT